MEGRDEQLEEGWRIFSEWRDARARAGDPLPPSVVCLLTRDAIIKDVLVELVLHLAAACGVAPETIAPAVRWESGMVLVDTSVLGELTCHEKVVLAAIKHRAGRALDERLAAFRELCRGGR